MGVVKITVLVMLTGGLILQVSAQTSCVSVDTTTFCNGETLPAVATTQADENEALTETLSGSSRTVLSDANGILIESPAAGMQAEEAGSIATQAGTTTIVNAMDGGVSTVSRAADTTFVNRAQGKVVICQTFGSITLCN